MSAIQDLLLSYTLGDAHKCGALRVHPLVKKHEVQAEADYTVLDEALETGEFEITEVSASGSVPHLLAINHLSEPIFLLDGEELVGAKQNRVLNLSFIVPPGSRTEIPVSCVEAGRWQRHSDKFQAVPRAQFAEGRARKMTSVSASLEDLGIAASDQGDVWDSISEKASRMAVHSPTAAMAALFEDRKDDLEAHLSNIPSIPGQAGAIYVINDRIVGLDAFGSPQLWQKLKNKVHASYAIDALEHEEAGCGSANVSAFLQNVTAAAQQRYAAGGKGETVRLNGVGVSGAAVEVDGRCVHLAAFAN